MAQTLEELFELPEHVSAGAYVVKLVDALEDPGDLLDQYVVTEQLEQCFKRALNEVREALDGEVSAAAYLHGSFGAGKSHFMGVMHAILSQDPRALQKEGLEEVVAQNNSWLSGKKFLLVPYHMIGARSMEAGLLGGYVDYVRRVHPDAPLPMVYRGEGILRDAAKLRSRMGDDQFFEGLGGKVSGGKGWGKKDQWDATSYESAAAADPGDPKRESLLRQLIATYFENYADVMAENREGFVSIDRGLAVISRHAEELGYDALVLFVDELILWLASHAVDTEFLARESQKLSKLTESTGDRPIPIISFVARQRSLRDFVGETLTGQAQRNVDDQIQYFDARFTLISLEDRNLPEIVSRRLLRPRSTEARKAIDDAFAQIEKSKSDVLDILQTGESDRLTFRRVYPFSPAVVQALVAVSSVLQRERTALKVMAQLLVERREMELGGVVPIGDLFDVIASGDAPFADEYAHYFAQAKKLYSQKLLPTIAADAGLRAEDYEEGKGDEGARKRFETNDRLVKTLLIASLAPESEVLRDLTAKRLAALNHGSALTPIPGQEAAEVTARLRTWAAKVGEIKISGDEQPTFALQLTGVDTDSILAKVASVDTSGARLRLLRDLVYGEMDVTSTHELYETASLEWKGTVREFDLLFKNVRDLPDNALQTEGEQRKVIIDFPFDEAGHDPQEDLQRLRTFLEAGAPARTLVWLPSFLSDDALRDLGTLVRLEYLLTGDRLQENAQHLSEQDRLQARVILDGRRAQLRQHMLQVLMGAYGVHDPVEGTLSESRGLDEHIVSLDPSTKIRPAVGGNLRSSFETLLRQVLEGQYPRHPDFQEPVKISNLRKVLEVCQQAQATKDKRILVDKSIRPLMHRIAVPMDLGEMGETHFHLGRSWYDRLVKLGQEATVAELRAAMDQPEPRGMPPIVQNVVLMVYASQADSTFSLMGGPYEASLEKIRDEAQLKKIDLPTHETWEVARDRAKRLFGVDVSALCNATNVEDLVDKVEAVTRDKRDICAQYYRLVEEKLPIFDLDPNEANRAQTARTVVAMLDALQEHADADFVRTLAQVEVQTSADAMGTSLKSASRLVSVMEGTNWGVLQALRNHQGAKRQEADALLKELEAVLGADEYAVSLANQLQPLEDRATAIVLPKETPFGEILDRGAHSELSASEARRHIEILQKQIETHGERVKSVRLQWTILGRKAKDSK